MGQGIVQGTKEPAFFNEIITARDGQSSLDDRIGSLPGIIQIETDVQPTSGLQVTGDAFPVDDTIPQITEGSEILSVTLTPTSSTHTLVVIASIFFRNSSSLSNAGAIFRDDQTDALAVSAWDPWEGTTATVVPLLHVGTAGTTSPLTISVRVGKEGIGSQTITLNQVRNGAYGNVGSTRLIVAEIK